VCGNYEEEPYEELTPIDVKHYKLKELVERAKEKAAAVDKEKDVEKWEMKYGVFLRLLECYENKMEGQYGRDWRASAPFDAIIWNN
jgi:hypothetical protein